jgi:hypothetical protein
MTAANSALPGGKIKPRRAVLARAEAAPVLALDGALCVERHARSAQHAAAPRAPAAQPRAAR